MTYRDLPKEETVIKLLNTSFREPKQNLAIYEWSEQVLSKIRFVENERTKLIKKYGEKDSNGNIKVTQENLESFYDGFNAVLNEVIESDKIICPLEKEWLTDENCSFPKEKELWLTPAEIGAITNK